MLGVVLLLNMQEASNWIGGLAMVGGGIILIGLSLWGVKVQ